MSKSNVGGFVLLDDSTRFVDRQWELPPEFSGCRIRTETLHGGLRQGVQVVEVSTDRVQVQVLLSRGGGIGRLVIDGVSLGWRSPISGPVHPNFVPLYRPDGLGWLAGFDETLARCGLLNVGGPQFNEQHQLEFPLHGAIAHQPCSQARVFVSPADSSLIVETVCSEVLFHFHRLQLRSRLTLRLGQASLELQDEIENQGGRSAEVLLLHHWNFGPPLVQPQSLITVAHTGITPRNRWAEQHLADWDRMQAPAGDGQETVYFFDQQSDPAGQSHSLLECPAGQQAVHFTWPTAQFPCLTLWKNPVALEDGYAIGMEPGTCFPNGRAAERTANRTITLPPGAKHESRIQLNGLIDAADSIQTLRSRIQTLSGQSLGSLPL